MFFFGSADCCFLSYSVLDLLFSGPFSQALNLVVCCLTRFLLAACLDWGLLSARSIHSWEVLLSCLPKVHL
jgi:hypothetical protein